FTGAIETKCLAGYKQVKAFFEKEYPKEYHNQVIQYFLVNDDLETLHFVMYHDDMPEKLQMLIFEVSRADILNDMEVQKEVLQESNKEAQRLLEIIYGR
ncbi:hypothetical protein N8148_03005, partial [Gammaproteobacteria bacterium]|nr:hypothetical protein [Gammaproteobacteria bacterium]